MRTKGDKKHRWIPKLSRLQRKLIRDLWHLRGQIVAIALVVACGVASFVSMRSTYDSLVVTQSSYYSIYRFSDIFLHLKRAPKSLVDRVRQINGVSEVRARVVGYVTVNLPDLDEPAQAKIVSLPETRRPILNDLHFQRGRYFEPGASDEIVISGGFADANGFRPGDSVTVILNGRLKKLRIVGVALSPEFVYEIRPGDVFPDNKRYGIIWMSERSVSSAFQMEGAFNDLVLTISPGANSDTVITELDELTAIYGGLGAYSRDEHVSHRFLESEITQQEVFGTIVPLIFLTVVAFLVHLVLSRLIATQREQIAVLKAFGYTNRAIGWHYLQLALASVLGGVIVGVLAGAWLGSAMTTLYAELFRFPILSYVLNPLVVLISFVISFAAASFGALYSVRNAVSLPPAEAMRPEPPPDFEAGLFERSGLAVYFSSAVRMIARSISRRPVKAMLSIFGISLSVSLLVVGFYMFDAIDRLISVQFENAIREDASILFTEPVEGRVSYELYALPGVRYAELFRSVPVRLRNGHRSKRLGLLGLDPRGSLRQIVNEDYGVTPLSPGGVILSSHLAELLNLESGDFVTVEVKEGARPVREVKVVQTVDELIGLNAYIDLESLQLMMNEGDTASGALVKVKPDEAAALYSRLKEMPGVATVTLPHATLKSFNETFAESINISTLIIVFFASVIAFGVIYNGARISLSERGREFASLRVLGFTQREVATLLLGEQAILTAAAIPVGFGLGILLSLSMNAAIDVELMRLPFVFSYQTFIYSFLIVVITAFLSGLLVVWRLRTLDLIEVLKTRE